MKFQPTTEEEARKAMLHPPGVYGFEVISAEDKQSKAGNDMIAIKLRVFGNHETTVHDYLMEKMQFKLIHFVKAAGLLAKYESGELLASDCVGRTGRLQLVIEEQPGFPPKNSVKDYVKPDDVRSEASQKPLPRASSVSEDSEPPF